MIFISQHLCTYNSVLSVVNYSCSLCSLLILFYLLIQKRTPRPLGTPLKMGMNFMMSFESVSLILYFSVYLLLLSLIFIRVYLCLSVIPTFLLPFVVTKKHCLI